jgi:molybdenum cofactor synthesis domain-containing protein
MPRLDETRPFIPVRIAVLTVSDTRGPGDDRSGDTLAQMIREAGHEIADRAIVKDDAGLIAGTVRGWIADPSVDVVITTGGTGFTGRDVTPEAVRPLCEKDDSVPCVRGAFAWHLHFLPAGLARRLQGCMERHTQVATRQSPPALQFRGNHAPAGRAPPYGVRHFCPPRRCSE